MTDLLFFALCVALWNCGVYIATTPGMILEPLDLWAEKRLPLWIYKPLIGCVFCMPSIHSWIVWTIMRFTGVETIPVLLVVAAVPIASSIGGFIIQKIEGP